jgi:hypothetical protein
MFEQSPLYDTIHEITLARKDSFLAKLREPKPPKYVAYNSIFSNEIDPLMSWFMKFTSSARSVNPEISYHNYYLYNVKVLVDA